MEPFRGTTVLGIRKNGVTAIAADGQVTMGNVVVKGTAAKVRRLHDGKVIAGFAGSSADAFALFERFSGHLEKHVGNLQRAAVGLASEWRTDKSLRRLEALLLVADRENILVISGAGDVIEPDDGIAGIGSGGPLAVSAARALARHSSLESMDIARESLIIASELCIYTNGNIRVEVLES
ncbi:MAG: HslU--HslV peptidase proteolytic subunit [Candidatus Wallbacteria bacterium HGW-Wallbacteria-1]|jgi:ATP-dependent HslUV protease subunit HslV|uniref:ATP-dependent protease subunit HslV n=1 Tax=Candidatus Wallbacteria bacterium HGW-Wallbacteria-1 TaxID=2013854 RepID=A0A2N1PSS5_9BACT|nr:MAG: HslU--HslV peptidase proteolytic subunit [Candidatus Wallbacteria bacterium HGW-Wallbacteria-1]